MKLDPHRPALTLCADALHARLRAEAAGRGIPSRPAATPIAERPTLDVDHDGACPANVDSDDDGHGSCLCGLIGAGQ